jgi:Protein of unknown function (DUF2591)
MQVKVSGLSGVALAYAVAVAEDLKIQVWPRRICVLYPGLPRWVPFSPESNWAHGGPIMHSAGIFPSVCDISCEDSGLVVFDQDNFSACTPSQLLNCEDSVHFGPTPLIAAMRCFVASKLGAVVDIPESLM